MTRVTVEREGHPTEVREVVDDFLIVCDGRAYVDGVSSFPTTGTTVVTFRKHPELAEVAADLARAQAAALRGGGR